MFSFESCFPLLLRSKFEVFGLSVPGLCDTVCDTRFRIGFSVRSVARVSATLVIDVRERFISAACRLYGFWKRCSVYSVVSEKVVLSRWCFVLWWTEREKVRQKPARR